ncbi:RagB/SusD family nutrient uptake outer membrane protein [Niabella beijingensis]|uniref:RagB/SusD family nutrient uptake outer membrane protein n=1 Tax=Niabella beijingensis TaxID=2872700 RepID=UPI001CC072A7|nr:RagB/SusD family nutrient uptake outer membrane protein [Niabella beijingensis]MBZ4188876.1 RagB/SusD family nutrient uptake outer membrane protein [Niabella beijingensis]
MSKHIIHTVSILLAGCFLTSCNKFLDKEPLSSLTPEQYLTTESNIASYSTDLYNTLPVHGQWDWGTFQYDNNTDNMAYVTPSDIFAPGFWRVGQTGGSYAFDIIYRCNYFFDKVLPLQQEGKITGIEANIKQYIGEVYFFRAFNYFSKLMALGDFPIVKELYANDLPTLVAVSKRAPCNEVARFILDDLNQALALMPDAPPVGGRNRLNKDAVRLFKSRVALFEGTWLKYFKGTAFVPNGPGWPGKTKNPDYAFPSGSIDGEIDFFLSEAMKEAKTVADKYALVTNTGTYQSNASDPSNAYFDMFGATNMNPFPEIILWKQYDFSLGVTNTIQEFMTKGNNGYGTTRSMINAFVMTDGKPIYKAPYKTSDANAYWGDEDLLLVTKNRDSRARIFFKKPGDNNLHSDPGQQGVKTEPYPDITSATPSLKYTTGYAIRKGLNFDGYQTNQNYSTSGSIIFRAAEAYLNYIEACYERTGQIDGIADAYWKAIRKRALINEDYQYTISLTSMEKEAETDWGAYSAGKLVDATLYNIRRERRCELMAEGFRPMDIRRWRSLDQMISTPYHIQGINLWDKTAALDAYKGLLKEGGNVSPKSFSKYLSPYHIFSNNRVYNGYRWNMAHYLEPIAIQHFLITGNGDAARSPLYQNPGWPLTANERPK